MSFTKTELLDELEKTLASIDMQIDAIERGARMELPLTMAWKPEYAFRTRYKDGKYVMVDMLAARANVLMTIAAMGPES